MPRIENGTLELTDARRRRIGSILVESVQGDAVEGRFTPGADFGEVEPLFRRYEEAADAQALSVIDTLDGQIAALGFRAVCSRHDRGSLEEYTVSDLQIWHDGGVSLRLGESTHPVTTRSLENGLPLQSR